jgi:Plasmid pRiA4b ORF-3-like protein
VASDEPTIMRLLLVPSALTFGDLHEVLQIAFGWADCHAHSFDVSRVPKEGEVRPFSHPVITSSFFLA